MDRINNSVFYFQLNSRRFFSEIHEYKIILMLCILIMRSYVIEMFVDGIYFVFRFLLMILFISIVGEVEFGSQKYYALCGLGGMLSCGVTHTGIVPLDLVKCRIQVDPAKYKGIFNGFKVSFVPVIARY